MMMSPSSPVAVDFHSALPLVVATSRDLGMSWYLAHLGQKMRAPVVRTIRLSKRLGDDHSAPKVVLRETATSIRVLSEALGIRDSAKILRS